MNQESKTLTTADLANAAHQAPPESIAGRPAPSLPAEPQESEPIGSGGAAQDWAGGAEQRPGSQNAPAGRLGSNDAATVAEPLFERGDAEGLRSRWSEIQVGFVDEPRAAVEKADSLVAETIKRLADSFAASRRNLEREWDREGDVSTEGLRLALQRYRSFFNRLLSL